MYGGAGSDTIDGGAGNDYLQGDNYFSPSRPGGYDTFVFEQGHGDDTIRIFEDGVDKLDLTAFTDITSFDDLTITTQDNEVVIDLSAYGGGTILFETGSVDDIEIGDLDASDFVFYEPRTAVRMECDRLFATRTRAQTGRIYIATTIWTLRSESRRRRRPSVAESPESE